MYAGEKSIEIFKKNLAPIRIAIEFFLGLTLFITVFDVSAPDLFLLLHSWIIKILFNQYQEFYVRLKKKIIFQQIREYMLRKTCKKCEKIHECVWVSGCVDEWMSEKCRVSFWTEISRTLVIYRVALNQRRVEIECKLCFWLDICVLRS